ncbi:MAG: hypothetical protein K2K98_14860 [Muribaculaceae bacterium]|nr:hypothetical protein [Muribaculaceae bacterium]
MKFKISDVSGSAVSRFSFGIMACCITSLNIVLHSHNGYYTTWAYVWQTIAGIVLLAWIIWFFYMYISGKKIPIIPGKAGTLAEAVNWLIFVIWILSDFVSAVRHPLLGIIAWCLLAASVIYYFVYCKKSDVE